MQDVLALLRERGFVQDISDEKGLQRRLENPITLYCGYDPTAPSLTIGHLVTIMMLAWFQRCGHRPIALMGGGTTLVGDPTFRQTSRPILSPAEIDHNLNIIKDQVSHFLDLSAADALMLNNATWLTQLNFLEFLRDIGSRFSVNEVLRLEAYRTRLDAGGLSFLELSYFLLQSYDFLRLYQEYDCILQIGGSDQWGNSIMGADLIRRVTGGVGYVLVAPLLLTSSGVKMGKTDAGAVYLSVSPYEYYQYWRNVEDDDVERFLAIFTFLPMDDIRELGRLTGADLNRAKEILAFETTRLLHGEEEAMRARDAARTIFLAGTVTGMGNLSGDLTVQASIPTVEIARHRLEEGLRVADLFKLASLVTSANEARNLVAQRGLSINRSAVEDANSVVSVDALDEGQLLLSRGRKRHVRVVAR